MAAKNKTEKPPYWLTQAVFQNYRRTAFSVNSNDLEEFVSQLRITLRKPIEDPVALGKTLVDTDSKVFLNTGTESDTFTLKTQKTSTAETKKSYQLKVGKNFTYGLGGGINIGASFFNIGGIGASLAGSFSKSKTEEVAVEGGLVRGLSQEYGIEGEIKVPPKKKVAVEIRTYAISYTSNVHLTVKMPASATLRVQVAQGGCCGNKFIWLRAEQFLQLFIDDKASKPTKDGPLLVANYSTQLQYLGERTVIHKVKQEDLRI